ncbi:ATP-binding protein [Lacibacter sp. MH-610]|uniref:sensor histidine kinase n=1 Tax=Lacibacter sp. MH-610 TaxID=3020883 RepID=UPI003892394D
MFNKGYLTPVQIAAINAFAISLLVGLANFFFVHNWWIALLTFLILFLISYLLIRYFTERFIYRHIKLIYKFIAQTKATKREEFFNKSVLPEKSLQEVSAEVEEWAEQKKQEVEQLQQNEQYRKEFLQNLSHELKTPIFAVQGYVDTLLSGAMNKEEVARKFLLNTSRNIERLVNLVGDLDEISKLESGQLQLQKQNFIIQELVEDIFESLSIKATEKNIKTSIKKGCELPIAVYADKEKIRMVLINLVDNAIKYGKQNGHIIFSAYKTTNDLVLIEISDDGYGIAEEHLNRIFERFYRTDLARSRKEGGSGLGLAICKHIIEAHGKSIHVRSTIDVGSTFGFTLDSKSRTAA